MNELTFTGLVNNAALLITLGLIYDSLVLNHYTEKLHLKVLGGFIFGLIGIAVMKTPWVFMPGIIFDTRSILISVGGYFFGLIPTLIAMTMTAAFRMYQGGTGMWTGSAVIITSGLIGWGWKYFRRNRSDTISLLELYFLGVTVHIAMLLWMLSLPWTIAFKVLSNISLPVMIIYPVGTVLLGKLMTLSIIRRKSEKALKESEHKYRLLADNVTDAIWVLNLEKGLTYMSPAIEGLTGYTIEERMSMGLFSTFTHESEKLLADTLNRVLGNDTQGEVNPLGVLCLEVELIHKDGSLRWVELSTKFLRDKDGKVTDILGVSRDITERKQAEEQIKASLKEKEILLSEIHHRVKNNMQVITSLLSLEGDRIKDEEARKPFIDSENRIRSMALVHEKLYQSKDLANIDFKEYIDELIQEIQNTLSLSKYKIPFELNVKKQYLDANKAIPCGQIITELVSNALKHAFPENKKGKITIGFKNDKTGNYILTVKDNGTGLPDDFESKQKVSLGYQLVNALVKQLKGEINISGKKGTEVTITFPE